MKIELKMISIWMIYNQQTFYLLSVPEIID